MLECDYQVFGSVVVELSLKTLELTEGLRFKFSYSLRLVRILKKKRKKQLKFVLI